MGYKKILKLFREKHSKKKTYMSNFIFIFVFILKNNKFGTINKKGFFKTIFFEISTT